MKIGRGTCFTKDFRGTSSKDKARQTVFLTPTNPFGNDPEEEEPHDDYTVPQKVPYVTRWKHNQRAVYWVRLSKALDQGLEFWQTKSFEIMTYATIPGGCIDRALKKNWHSQQQQQHSTSSTDVPSSWKREAEREDQSGAQDVTDHSTEEDLETGGIPHRTWIVDTHLGNKEVSTNAFSQAGAVKEEIAETRTKAIQRIKIGSNKIYIREEPGEGEHDVLP